MRFTTRLAIVSVAAIATLALAGCGGDDEADSPLADPAVTTLTPQQAQEPSLPSVDGYLVSATAEGVLLKTRDGDQTFAVAEQDLATIGIEHMQSHAGIQTLGFRVFYEERDGQRFIKQAMEIPPPSLEPAP